MRPRWLGASLALLSCLLSTTTLAAQTAANVPASSATGAPAATAPAASARSAAVDIDSARFRAHLISKALFADGRLWLLMESGHLETLSRADHRRMDLDIAPVVKDIWLRNGELLALTSAAPQPSVSSWSIGRLTNDSWVESTKIAVTEDERYVGGGVTHDGIAILTNRRLINLVGDSHRSVAVRWDSERLSAGAKSVAVTDKAVYVGNNAGEWGGWLRAVDRRSGGISTVAKQWAEPVTALVTQPNGCVAVAMGMVHFSRVGRVGEVCGNKAKTLYQKTIQIPQYKVDGSEAFFGVSVVGQDLWAVGTEGLYRIGRDGTAELTPLPKPQEIGDLTVSFESPDFALVATSINQHWSVGGEVPIFAPVR